MPGEALEDLASALAPHLARHRAHAHLAQDFRLSWRDWCVDLSRARWDREVLAALLRLLATRGFARKRDALFAGEPVNRSEKRAALHIALRAAPEELEGAAAEAAKAALAARKQMLAAVRALRAGKLKGFAGAPLAEIVHVGWGGSELGPRLVYDAFADAARLPVFFWNAADPVARDRLLAGLDAPRTLFVLVSKSGTTEEVHWAREEALAWLAAQGCPAEQLHRHFWIVSAHPERLATGPLAKARTFPLWDWVGGRFSLWSSVSVAVAAALGEELFAALLAGARAMDRHFLTAPLEENLPVVLGLMSAWHRLLGIPTRAVFAYDIRLRWFVEHLQQLEMESLGKGVDEEGMPLAHAPCAVVWGGVGTRAEHAVFQWLHQAPELAAVELLGVAQSPEQRLLLAHLLGQAEALWHGNGEIPRYAHCPGGRPVSVLLLPRLDAFALGALIALFEHRVFVQAVLFGINPFDQWGVELGKRAARRFAKALAGGETADDPLVDWIRRSLRMR